MATKAEKNFEKALLELAAEDVSLALSVLTGCFVSLTLEVLRRNGHVPDCNIKIDGGDQRDITIHAPKMVPPKEGITHYCLGNGAKECEGCGQEKNWQLLNQLPDALRLGLQAQAQSINDTDCILSGRPWYIRQT